MEVLRLTYWVGFVIALLASLIFQLMATITGVLPPITADHLSARNPTTPSTLTKDRWATANRRKTGFMFLSLTAASAESGRK